MSQVDLIFPALAHPVRRQMLDDLLSGQMAVKNLGAKHRLTPGAISQHLRVLEDAGLVLRHVQGREHHIELRVEGLKPAIEWAGKYAAFWQEKLVGLGDFLSQEDSGGS